MDISGGKWRYTILLAIIGLCQRRCFSFDTRCPAQSEWNLKGSATCGIALEFFCVLDDNVKSYTQFCKHNPDLNRDIIWKKGQKCVLRGNLDGEICSTERYQPFIFRTDGNSDCVYKKSLCQGEGMTVYKNGSTTVDTQCRCDHSKGFAFASKIKQRCYCIPSQEDCSCYKKKCKSNFKLSSDYKCKSIYSQDDRSTCHGFDTRSLINDDSQEQKLKQVIKDFSPENDVKQFLITKTNVRRHAAITVTGFTGFCIAFAFIIFYMEGTDNKDMRKTKANTYVDEKPGEMTQLNKESDYRVGLDEKNENFWNEGVAKNIREVYEECINKWCKNDKKFTVTSGTIEIGKMLKQNNCVLVVGRSGNGKSALIRHIALELLNEEGFDIFPTVDDPGTILQYYNPKKKQMFIMDEFCGKTDLSPQKAETWSAEIDKILRLATNSQGNAEQKIHKGTTKLLFAIEPCVYKDRAFRCIDCLSKFKFDISTLPLKYEEIIKMIKKYSDEEPMSDETSKTLKGREEIYPFLYKLSVGKTVKEIMDLFSNPDQVIGNDLYALKQTNKHKLCLIASCVLLESIQKVYFRDVNDHAVIEGICCNLEIDIQKDSTIKEIYRELEDLKETYFTNTAHSFFLNENIYDIAAAICGDIFMELFIRLAPYSFIGERYCFKSNETNERKNLIYIKDEEIEKKYFDRLMKDLEQMVTYSTFHNRQLKHDSYRDKFCNYCRRNKDQVVELLNKLQKRHPDPSQNQNEKTTDTCKEKMNEYEDYLTFLMSSHFFEHKIKMPLIESAWEGHVEVVDLLVELKLDINGTDNFGRSALFVACQRGKKQVADLLLDKKANYSLCDSNGVSPLLTACKGGYTDIILKLLEIGANAHQRDNDGCLPLHAASKASHKTIVEKLLTYEDTINTFDNLGRSALVIASHYGRKEVVNLLLKHEARLEQSDNQGFTPLLAACSENKLNVVKDLVKWEADISKTDEDGRSALYVACEKQNKRMVDFLLQKQASVSQCDKNGNSPLHIACASGHDNIVCLLLDGKAEISQCNGDGRSPLFIACEKGHDTIVNILLNKVLEKPVSYVLDKADIYNRSPLYVACKGGFIDIVMNLVSKGAEVNRKNVWEMTPLFVASREGHADVVQCLIDGKATLDLQDYNGQTPLSVACDAGNADVVRILIKNNADVDHKDKDNKTPLDLAQRSEHTDIVDMIKSEQSYQQRL